MAPDYYSVLGITTDATPDEIRAAYFDAARRLHPDVNPDSTSHELFLQIQLAYDILSNPQKRADVDAELTARTLTNPAVGLTFRMSRRGVPRLDEPQLVYLLADLTCTADPGKVKPPAINLCLVVDRSTSMAGARMDMVKANLAQVFRALNPHDILSMVAFSDRAEVILPPTTVQQLSKNDKSIFLLQTGGGTEIYQGLKAGMDQLRLAGVPSAVQQLILITDGHTYGDEQACLSLAEQARLNGVTISAVGIGHEWNDELLDRIATASGGSTGFISTARDLSLFLQEKVTAFSQMYASGLTLSLKANPLVELSYAFRLYPEIAPLPVGSPISLGSLQYGRGIQVLFELYVRELPPETSLLHLLRGWLYLDVFEPRPAKARLAVEVKLPVNRDVLAGLPPPDILESLAKITLYRMQEKARAEVAAGDVASATRRLQYMATHLLAKGDQELAHTVLMEAEHIRQSQTFSKEGDKRIKYATRALLLPAGGES